ncbi:MAG: hypothetical protein GEU75_16710 [Dehalococcoidia bacterium]|nr:hypothetical protein [Dehalococcoidia bacterium]
MRDRYDERPPAEGSGRARSTVRVVVMYEVFFALVGAMTGFVFGGVELGAACLFFGSVLGMGVGLLQRG